MISSTGNLALNLSRNRARPADFLELAKPRVVLMILFATLTGIFLGSGRVVNPALVLNTLLGTALAAAGSLALNQYLERGVDSRMERTRRRPLPQGRMSPRAALLFGSGILIGGLVYLAATVNLLSALLTTGTAAWYLWVYTPSKRKTSLCLLVGAVCGATPPVIGWAAARGEVVSLEAWVLFGILFLWQIPHTLAIGQLYRDDYARAGIRILPAVEPTGDSTRRQVLVSSLALLAVGLLPFLMGMAGRFYFLTALVLGTLLVSYGLRMAIIDTRAAARHLLFATLAYLPVLFLLMILDGPRVAIW